MMKNNSNIIGQRINTLLAINNKKQKELAEYLNVTDNTISYFCSGTRVPNTEQIIKISTFFSVSADYILGLSEVSTRDTKIKDICEYVGLSEAAINSLRELDANYPEVIDMLNCFIEFDGVYSFLKYCIDYKQAYTKASSIMKEAQEHKNEKFGTLKPLYQNGYFDLEEKIDMYLFRIQKITTHFAKHIIKDINSPE